MSYLIIVPFLGLSMLVLLMLTNLIGLKVIKAKLRVHRRLSVILLLFILVHGIYGWAFFNPSAPVGTIAGTILFVLVLLNILFGTRRLKLKLGVHRGLGYTSIFLGLLHGVLGFLKTFGIVYL